MASTSMWPGLITGISGLLTSLFPDVTNTSGTQKTAGTTSGTSSSSTTPQMSTLQSMLSNMFGAGAMNNFENIPNIVNAEKIGGLQNINAGETAADTSVGNTLAARGLAYSPYAGTAMAQPAIAAQAQKSNLLTSLPLLAQSLTQSDLAQLMAAMGATGPLGSTTSGTSNLSTTGSTNTTGKTVNQGIFGSLFG